jgi:hypothetical protein
MVGYTKKLKKLLREAGCEFHQQGRGDHETWKTSGGVYFTVDNNIKSKHTANATLKQAGLEKAF